MVTDIKLDGGFEKVYQVVTRKIKEVFRILHLFLC
jgi:hypothetical protein